MMKKNGFTLAEVLITLAIIGVVATLTLPALITNTAEQQAITAYRKALNTLNEAGQMNVAVDGFDYSQLADGANGPSAESTIDSETGAIEKSLWSILVNRAQVDIKASTEAKVGGECDGLSQVFFRDGTVLCYEPTATSKSDDTVDAWIDTNGIKGPNQKSQCKTTNCLAAGKAIKDQFPVTLHGTNALPGKVTFTGGVPDEKTDNPSKAARWAMRK